MNVLKQVKILTPESVELEFTLAGIGGRAIALIVDYLALLLGVMGLLWLWGYLLDLILPLLEDTVQGADVFGMWLVSIFLLVLFAWYVGYFVGFETYWYGQTPGKRLAKVRVIRDDGQPTRLFQSTLRSLMRPLDDFLFLGYFMILLGKREKRLGDFLAGTLVVQVDPRTATDKIVLSDRAVDTSEKLLDAMAFERVSPDDFAILREYLQRRQRLIPRARRDLGLRLAEQIRDRVGLENLPDLMTPELFLEGVYQGYQQFRSRS